MRFLPFLFLCSHFLFSNTLQIVINNAPDGATIKLKSGIYSGNIVITKPITVIGIEDDVIIQGENKGDVITIKSSNVKLENLIIKNSGNRLENLDSAVLIEKVNNCEINNCKILNSLYGINMSMVKNSKIIDNYITSKDNDISLKGDALKVWYSSNNIFKNNLIEKSRDSTFTYAHNNIIENNTFIHNRYGTHISLSKNNLVKNNFIQYNLVGMILTGAKNTKVVQNSVLSSSGAAGMGLVIIGGQKLTIKENKISFNTHGIYIDVQDTEQGMQRYIKYNEISYNKEALHFHAAIKNNTITGNKIFGNMIDIGKDVRGNFTNSNIVEYNYWDRYSGFDKDKDNIGDTKHTIFQYSDRLYNYNKKIKFFYATPVLSAVDFILNLAPFVEPVILLEDKKPIIKMEDKF